LERVLPLTQGPEVLAESTSGHLRGNTVLSIPQPEAMIAPRRGGRHVSRRARSVEALLLRCFTLGNAHYLFDGAEGPKGFSIFPTRCWPAGQVESQPRWTAQPFRPTGGGSEDLLASLLAIRSLMRATFAGATYRPSTRLLNSASTNSASQRSTSSPSA